MTDESVCSIEIATNAVDGELAAWRLALNQLAKALGDRHRFALLTYDTSEAALESGAPLVGLSLLGELARDRSFAQVEAEAIRECAAITAVRVVFVSTILRHLPTADTAMMARLRRLNLLTAQLSQQFGLLVIDIDRELAHRGALALETDAGLSGLRGQEAAARVIANAVLSYGLADLVEDVELDSAIAAYEASVTEESDRLTAVTGDLASRRHTSVGTRIQKHISHLPDFDDRGLRGLLRDLRHGRISVHAAAFQIGRKVLTRLPDRFHSLHRRTHQ